MRKLTAIFFFVTACGSSFTSEETGDTQVAISVPGGETLNLITYNISNSNNTYTGTADTTNGINFVLHSLASGSNYTAVLSGITTDNQSYCSGTSSAFNIVNRQVTTVMVNLFCVSTNVADAGSIQVEGGITTCPTIFPLTLSHANPQTGGWMTVWASGTVLAGHQLSFTWYLNGAQVYPSCQAGAIPCSNTNHVFVQGTWGFDYLADVMQFNASPGSNSLTATVASPGLSSSGCPNLSASIVITE